jgi:hypothetical protein
MERETRRMRLDDEISVDLPTDSNDDIHEDEFFSSGELLLDSKPKKKVKNIIKHDDIVFGEKYWTVKAV